MKRYIIIIIAIIGAGLSSCNDMLELQNDGRISMSEVFKTRNGVTGYLNACYNYRLAPSLDRVSLTDDAQDADDMFGSSLFNRWYANSFSAMNYSNTDGSPWAGFYEGIRKCNVFLANMETLDPESILNWDGEISSWIAEAKTLRACYYLEIIKRYGACPLITVPYETLHNFGADTRAPVSEVVRQIVKDCDEALAAPEISLGFSWSVSQGRRGVMTRPMALFLKSQAILFAASPLFSDGTFTWTDARDASKTALAQCLSHGYELFNTTPDSDVAQNAYAYYFISTSDEQQAFDKETIYSGAGTVIWQQHGLQTTPGQVKAGACPTQELVDSYEMQATGEPPVSGYTDPQHLNPVINTASGYNPDKPYEGRDPRFYASIYYNGAIRQLGIPGGLGRDDHFPLTLDAGGNQINYSVNDDGEYRLEATGSDPYLNTSAIGKDLEAPPGSIYVRMQYKAPQDINGGEFFFCKPNAAGGIETGTVLKFPKAADWTDWEVDITEWAVQFTWGNAANHRLRFDFSNESGHILEVRNMEVVVESSIAPAAPVETFVGGTEGITSADRRTTRTGYYLRKYNNWKSSKDNSADGEIRKFRLAELYLNFAEAAYQTDGADAKIDMGSGLSMSARDAVNAIRSRADMPPFPAGMTKEAFEKKYRNERRVELAFEDSRYFDIRRWKTMEELSRYVTGMRITPDGSDFRYQRISIERLSYGEKYYLYPLSSTEVNKMQDHTGTNWQNPGWN